MSDEQYDPTAFPEYSPDARRRVQQALNGVLLTAKDVLTRHSRDGLYQPPDPVPFGDVTGLIEAGNHQIILRLQSELDSARQVLRDVYAEIEQSKRDRHGPNYKPLPRDL